MKQFKLVVLGLIFLSLVSCSPNPKQVSYGEFFTIAELYEKKVIAVNDVASISYANSNGKDVHYEYPWDGIFDFSAYEIKKVNPDDLTEEVKTKIINDYYYDVFLPMQEEDSKLDLIHMIDIRAFCGVYNGFYALRFDDNSGWPLQPAFREEQGITFNYSNQGFEVVLWKENK